MPRTPGIRYFDSRGAYYTQHRGVQHLLAAGPKDEPDGPTYKEAARRFGEVMAADPTARAAADDALAVSVVIARYYFELEREANAQEAAASSARALHGRSRRSTLKAARAVLDGAIAAFGHLAVGGVTPGVVNGWLARMSDPARPLGKGQKPWSASTQSTAVERLLRAFNWAAEQKLIARNPIAGMKRPDRLPRGSAVVLPRPLMDALVGPANSALRAVLGFLRETGCRPGEAINARASHYRKGLGALVFPWRGDDVGWQWKCARKTKRDRVIYLTPTARDLVEVAVAVRPDGYLFVGMGGRPWTNSGLFNSVYKLRRRAEVRRWCRRNDFAPEGVMPYGFRHTYITNMLLAGVPVKVLADWCGTSVAMLERTYSHIHDDLPAMRQLFLKFNGKGGD